MRLSPQSVARWSARRRFTVIGLWIVLFLVGGLLTARYLSGALTTQAEFTNNPDSKQARQLLEQRLTGPRRSNEVVIVRSDATTVGDPAFKAFVQRLKPTWTRSGRRSCKRPRTPTRLATGSCRTTATPP